MKQQFIGPTGAPIAFGLLYSYEAGTTTPLATYNASGATNPNPITLDASGRADVWVPPNIAYKFNLTDAAGNQIPGWPLDDIVNSQLITLYGGVDTGGANAYAINFTANFSSYTDGIIIYWIPSHSNTSGSTINVNGLGPVSILNYDGSALFEGEIIANSPSTILYKGGSFILLNTALAIAGTATLTGAGFSGSVTTNISWQRLGNIVVARILSFTGTSNSTSFSLSGLPAALLPAITQTVSCAGIVLDNGSVLVSSELTISAGGSLIFSKIGVTTAFTNSGTKGLNATLSVCWVLQ